MDPGRTKPVSLAQLAAGAAGERFDYTVQRVIENIRDINTDATATRTVTLQLTLKPSEDRETIAASIRVNVTQPNLKAHQTPMWIDKDGDNYILIGLTPQGSLPLDGQTDIEDKVVGKIQGAL